MNSAHVNDICVQSFQFPIFECIPICLYFFVPHVRITLQNHIFRIQCSDIRKKKKLKITNKTRENQVEQHVKIFKRFREIQKTSQR